VRIHEIYENSPAAKSGKLRSGDRLLRLNDTELTGLSHEAVLDLLRSAQDKVERHARAPRLGPGQGFLCEPNPAT